jgi:anti-sigma-K factor RskA
MIHEEISELLATYALDAVVSAECADIEAHLERCPRCRGELDAYRDVAAALGNSAAPLPEGLWLSIVSRLPDSNEEPSPMPRLFHDAVNGTDAARPRQRHLSSRARFGVVGSILGAAAAAAAAAALLAFGLLNAGHTPTPAQAAPAAPASGVVAALETPGHKVINLGNGSARAVAQFVLAGGRGYLVSSKLPALGRSETYQLWGVVNGQPISLGLLGQSPSGSVFTLAGSAASSQLRITVEPSGGSVVPSGALVASGLV